MIKKLDKIKQQFLEDLEKVTSAKNLAELEIKYLGRKQGALTAVLRGLKTLAEKERAAIGMLANQLKREIEGGLHSRKEKLGSNAGEKFLDITAPGVAQPEGHLHLVTQAIREITEVFARIGFSRVSYPEVEWDYYAFEALNMPAEHPARDEWETFFVDAPIDKKWGRMVLTPHTSSGQVRELEKGMLPIRMMNIAKCYRRQADASHVPMFHQFEGLMIDKNITVPNLKGVVDYFVKQFFGPERVTRLRPFHFQFTEPSFEIDVTCGVCGGRGCRLCKEGWLELAGAGMVHPNVLKFGGIDPSKYSGWAFGWGVERTYLMKAGLSVPDIRLLYSNDLRFLKQF